MTNPEYCAAFAALERIAIAGDALTPAIIEATVARYPETAAAWRSVWEDLAAGRDLEVEAVAERLRFPASFIELFVAAALTGQAIRLRTATVH